MKRSFSHVSAILTVLACTRAGYAQGTAKPPNPVYPKVNPTPWYAVDADWPKRPKDIEWAAVPGVFVDNEDNVWMFTRATPSVQVYAPDGSYLFGWGEGTGAHHLKIDREGYVWTTDLEKHVVRKHRRDG